MPEPNEARGNNVTAREILDKASVQIDTSLANDRERQARMMSVLGKTYSRLGLYTAAQPLLERAIELGRRARSGFPTSGPMFRTTNGTPLAMGNVLNRLVLPVLSRCSVCKLPKGKRHLVSDHDWIRDGSVPEWRGWHAFRRGVATNLQYLGANVVTAQGALRHSDASVTLALHQGGSR